MASARSDSTAARQLNPNIDAVMAKVCTSAPKGL
jgi:hypothetical protein